MIDDCVLGKFLFISADNLDDNTATIEFKNPIKTKLNGKYKLEFYSIMQCNSPNTQEVNCSLANNSISIKTRTAKNENYNEVCHIGSRQGDFKWINEACEFTSLDNEIFLRIDVTIKLGYIYLDHFLVIFQNIVATTPIITSSSMSPTITSLQSSSGTTTITTSATSSTTTKTSLTIEPFNEFLACTFDNKNSLSYSPECGYIKYEKSDSMAVLTTEIGSYKNGSDIKVVTDITSISSQK